MSDKRTARHMGAQQERSKMPIVLLALIAVAGVVAVAAFFVLRGGWNPQGEVSMEDGSQQEVQQPATDEVAEDQETAPAEPVSAFKALLDAGEVQSIRLIGDSITAGWGTEGFFNPYEGNVIYDNGLGKVHYEPTSDSLCWANAFRTYAAEHGVASFVNAGIGGAFMVGDFSDSPDAWIREGADVIFVALGTNDAGYYGPDEFRAAAEVSLAAAAQKSKLVVVVSPVSDLRPQEWLVEPAATLADVLRPICEEHGYVFIDASAAVAPEQFNDDGLHPNSEGSLAIWECIRTALGIAE